MGTAGPLVDGRECSRVRTCLPLCRHYCISAPWHRAYSTFDRAFKSFFGNRFFFANTDNNVVAFHLKGFFSA